MLKTKQQTTNVLDFFHSGNRNVHVIHCTTTSFDEHPTRITSICARFGGTGEKRAFVPEHPPLSNNEIDAWEREILAKFQDFMKKNPRTWSAVSRTLSRFKGSLYYLAGLITSAIAGWLIPLAIQWLATSHH